MEIFKDMLKYNPDSNIFFSPVSVSSALHLLLLGTNGETAKQISSVLEPKNENFKKLIVANRVYCDWRLNVLTSFIDKVRDDYVLVNFDHNPENIINLINDWVREKTNNKICKIISNIGCNTKLLVVNATYFKSKWRVPFSRYNTHQAKFWNSNTSYKNVSMMYNFGTYAFSYIKEHKIKIIEIPYADDYSMVIILPDEIDGLYCLENQLSTKNVLKWLDTTKLKDVNVMIPKIKMEKYYDLKDNLKRIGVTDIFTNNANFENMALPDHNNDIFISKFCHKACIEIDEDGTEAAAATCVCVTDCACVSYKDFYATRPFIFIIKDDSAFLFMGKFYSP
ncbi:serpin-like protein [Deerpox virus W-1170-84]|uniref:Serpin-like protein n=1 Tax=Deerpox virus (strain W-1170-84) TaxID=305676 RepID=Q08F15_DPV84|nr:serpin-like protein [Deerpox virus W-1170-84]